MSSLPFELQDAFACPGLSLVAWRETPVPCAAPARLLLPSSSGGTSQVARELLLPTRGELDRTCKIVSQVEQTIWMNISRQQSRPKDQNNFGFLVLSCVAMSGQWEAVSLDLWPGVCSILLPWDRPPRPPLTLITAETCPPCPPRARVPRHFIATASYFTPSTSQQQIAPWRPQVNRSCII